MKKNLLFLFVLISTFQIQAQEVPEVQKSLITKVTATWCSNCGSWGWELFENLVEDNSEKALVIANHYSGDLNNPTSDAIADNFNVNSQPRFILNDTDQNASNGNIATKRTEIKDQVDNNFLLSPLSNAGLEATLDGNMLSVITKTRFFQPTMGEYYVGVYVIENGVINFQSNQGMNAVHKNVLRAGMSTSPFGELIMNGSIGMGMEFNHNFSMTLEDSWNVDSLEIATIVWKKNEDTYEFINTHSTSTFASPTNVVEINSDELTMTIQPTISKGNADLVLNIKERQNDFKIQIFNQLGQLQSTIFQGQLNTGIHKFALTQNLTAGIYYVQSQNSDAILTKQFIIQ